VDRRVRRTAVGIAGLLLVAGCSSCASEPGNSSDPASGTDITVGTSLTLPGTSFYLAAQDGTFTKNHLTATPQVSTSGAQSMPLLLNGQIQFAVSDPVGAIKAISENIPVQIVAQGPVVSPDPAKDTTGLIVDSSVSTVQDLAGKVVAVNSLNSLSQLAAARSIDLAGGDSSRVKFVEMPVPQMAAAVRAGTVTGAAVSEPYLSEGKAYGLKALLPVLCRAFPAAPMVVYLTSTSYASSHPQAVKEFAASIATANTTLAANPATLRSVGESVSKMTAAQLSSTILVTYVSTPISVEALKTMMDVMVSYNMLTTPIDLQSHIYSS
jgi:NitT/TauT family transport system substrate-binding protein